MAVTIQTRRDDAADWTTANPTLALGEIGIETDTNKAKYGDGFTQWSDLPYWIDTSDDLPDGTNGQTVRYGASWEATSDLFVSDAGNVGIGTDAPLRRFSVQGNGTNQDVMFLDGNGAASTSITFTDTTSTAERGRIRYDNTNAMQFHTLASERMRIDDAGNVGIGTNTPSRTLSLQSSGQTIVQTIKGTAAAGYISFTNNTITSDTTLRVGILNDSLTFWSGGGEAMRIDAGNRLLVGKTAFSSSIDNEVGTTIRGDQPQVAVVSSNRSCVNLNRADSGQFPLDFFSNAVAAGRVQISAGGGGTPQFVSGSDIALKENITNMAGELANVLALRPVDFDLKETGARHSGFIAQEVQEVWPHKVSVDERNGLLQLSGMDDTTTRLVKAIQELTARVEELEAQL